MKPAFDLLVAGAGFAGAVLAERFARVLGKSSLVIDRRHHVAGNAFDEYDRAGVLVHRYGPHYFRTNSERVRAYLSQFTAWRAVEYKILTFSDGRFWNFPINLNTFEQLLGRPSSTEEMEATLAKWRVPLAQPPRNSEEVIVAQVGRELYEKFFKNYTRKQWRRDPSELDPGVCGRIPIRTNRDDRGGSHQVWDAASGLAASAASVRQFCGCAVMAWKVGNADPVGSNLVVSALG